MSSDGSLTAIIPDSWLVDMFEEIDTRIEKLEEKVGLL
jgi:tetrahydromethanopterin S-methyltransferase subunit G